MFRLLFSLAAVGVIGVLLAAPAPPAAGSRFNFVDLQPKANKKLSDGLGSGREGNNLAAMPKGEETYAEIKFKVGESMLQLDSTLLADRKVANIEGIPVGRMLRKLHFLHGTIYGRGSATGQRVVRGVDPLFVADDAAIAEYRIRYADGDMATVPVIYGQDVRDWWVTSPIVDDKRVTRGKVAWTGDNPVAKESGRRLRVFLTTWQNPKPEKRVITVDYLKVGDNPCAPFCVAITAED